jgi:hypothetical protein
MNILQRTNSKGDKITFYYDLGRGPGQRPSTGIFIYKNQRTNFRKITTSKRSRYWRQKEARQ